LRVILCYFISDGHSSLVRILAVSIWVLGVAYVLRGIAETIEKTTEDTQRKTKVSGGLLQAFGTALPDMILGVVAAILSFQLRDTNIVASINYAIIAAATTFGSNVYNVGHAAWCIF